MGRLRRMASEFQGQFMDAMKEADIQSIRDEVDKLSKESALDTAFDPVRDIQSELTKSLDAPAIVDTTTSGRHPPRPATADFAIPAIDAARAGLISPLDETANACPPPVIAPHAEPDMTGRGSARGRHPRSPETRPSRWQPAPLRKRKIIQSKRRPYSAGPHDVSDRTRVGSLARHRSKAMES